MSRLSGTGTEGATLRIYLEAYEPDSSMVYWNAVSIMTIVNRRIRIENESPKLSNQFRRNLQQGQTLIGCWSALANHISAEVLGLAGFDWLVLDGEHAPNDVTTFIPQLMALKGSNSAPVVRAPCNEPSLSNSYWISGSTAF